MQDLTTELLVTACQIYLHHAYPDGLSTVPDRKRIFLDLPPGMSVRAFHAQQPLPPSTFQPIVNSEGVWIGVSLRLGNWFFPFMKLKACWKENMMEPGWVFTVDTHDAYTMDCPRPPADHPDYEGWLEIRQQNLQLKCQIENAWERAGLATFHALLRKDLPTAP